MLFRDKSPPVKPCEISFSSKQLEDVQLWRTAAAALNYHHAAPLTLRCILF